NECELKYRVAEWNWSGIEFWPLLKMHLFFTLQQEMQKKASAFQYYKSKIVNKLKRDFMSKSRRTPAHDNQHNNDHCNYLFVSASTYRMMYNGKSYSKFFDPIMDHLDESSSIQFEYHPISDYEQLYKSYRNIDYLK